MATGNLILITAAVLVGTALSVSGYIESRDAACTAPTAAEHRIEISYGSPLFPLVEVPAPTTPKKVRKAKKSKSVCEVRVTTSTRKASAHKCGDSSSTDASEVPALQPSKSGPATIGM